MARQFKDARLPLLPHRLVVGSQRQRRRAPTSTSTCRGPSRLRVRPLRRERRSRGHQAPRARTSRSTSAIGTTSTTPTGSMPWRACATSPAPSSCSGTSSSPTRRSVFDRDGRFMSDGRRASSCPTKERLPAPARLHEHAPARRSSATCWPCPRTSARSSSSRPTRGPNRRLYRATRKTTLRLGRMRQRRRRRGQVRDHERVVRAGRRGPRAVPDDDQHQHVPDSCSAATSGSTTRCCPTGLRVASATT